MRKSLLMSAAVLGMAMTAPAFAQGYSAGSPASQSGGNTAPIPPNSVPRGALTGGGNGGGTTNPQPMGTQPMAGDSGMSSDTGAAPMRHHGHAKHHGHKKTSAADQNLNGTDGETGQVAARSGHEPGVGDSEPSSTQASNTNRHNTRSDIAPRLPTPSQGANGTPQQYLRDADRALASNRTGAAQEALERAETRLLDQQAANGNPNAGQSAAVQAVSQARRDLANGNTRGARDAIRTAVNGGGNNAVGAGTSGASGLSTTSGNGTSAGMGAGAGVGNMGTGAGNVGQ